MKANDGQCLDLVSFRSRNYTAVLLLVHRINLCKYLHNYVLYLTIYLS